MAAKAKATGPKGVDRWTSNGYGVKLGPIPEANKKAIAEVNAQLAAKKPSAPAKKKK